MLHNRATLPRAQLSGAVEMAKRDAEVLEHILINLRLLSSKAQEADLGALVYMLESRRWKLSSS